MNQILLCDWLPERARYRFIIWLAPRVGKMGCDWLPERARWSYLARSGRSAMSLEKHFPESHIINPLLTKVVWSTWLDIGYFCDFMDLEFAGVDP